MTWLLLSVAALTIGMAACLFIGLAAASHIDLGDTADIDDEDDEDEDEGDIGAVVTAAFCPIHHIDPTGEHDRYPLPAAVRRLWIDYLDASWELPDARREPGATR